MLPKPTQRIRSATRRLGVGVFERAITSWIEMVALTPPSSMGRFVRVFASDKAPTNCPVERKNSRL